MPGKITVPCPSRLANFTAADSARLQRETSVYILPSNKVGPSALSSLIDPYYPQGQTAKALAWAYMGLHAVTPVLFTRASVSCPYPIFPDINLILAHALSVPSMSW